MGRAHLAPRKARALLTCGRGLTLELLVEQNVFFTHPVDAILARAAALGNWRLFEEVFDEAFDFEYPGWIHEQTLAKGRTFLDDEPERRERFDAAFARHFG